MKKIIYVLLLLTVTSIRAQADRITFSYDDAGNQVVRKLCFGCTTSKMMNDIPKEISALKEEDLVKFFPEDVISYYPNPVKEELFIKWDLKDDNLVNSIHVYGLSGQLLKSFVGQEKYNAQNIPFHSYPAGTYAIVLFYNTGEQKAIKIIKQ
ncbi:hypothetical protein IWX83_002975 [Flavobacterium sp. CG_9.1]|uniref:T9SS type A sorting domain-containing protein n=1 Tax=Flavobacterium sp. CG_9.1 TaxID=2787728 RepID=UPI0018C9AB31|nr:T9SS type A sorting domain-containing protein [Flavobacterium sp. CG_9.1]MBG6063165.1 hypothetical protein [Flavobacterium sp. CG_9.1]